MNNQLLPEVPPCWPRAGNKFTRCLGRSVLSVMGWRVTGKFPEESRLVLAGAPHTSNWDFVLAMAVLLGAGIKVHWLGKHSIFRWPFRRLLVRLGGIPVRRDAPVGVVEQAVAELQKGTAKVIGLAPEGTRSRVDVWKSGFLRIARGAGVPVLPIGIDYTRKIFHMGELFYPSEDNDADLQALREYFRQFDAKFPENAG